MREAEGRVVHVQASRCRVALDGPDRETVRCGYRKRLGRGPRIEKAVLVVGDRVRVEIGPRASVVTEILPRRNELSRQIGVKPRVRHVFAANLDQVLIVSSTRTPPLRTGFIDRCLAAAHVADIPGSVVINKMDLVDGEEAGAVEEIAGVYRRAGIPCLVASVLRPDDVARCAGRLRGRTSVLVGQSGVGKSSILNAIQPGLALRVGEISEATSKGRHTTTSSRLIELDMGGFVVDTPGVRSFGLETMTPAQVVLAFPEFAPYTPSCRFSSCTHVHEPDCAVKAAAERGEVVDWRYENYVRIIASFDEDG